MALGTKPTFHFQLYLQNRFFRVFSRLPDIILLLFYLSAFLAYTLPFLQTIYAVSGLYFLKQASSLKHEN